MGDSEALAGGFMMRLRDIISGLWMGLAIAQKSLLLLRLCAVLLAAVWLAATTSKQRSANRAMILMRITGVLVVLKLVIAILLWLRPVAIKAFWVELSIFMAALLSTRDFTWVMTMPRSF